MKISLTVCTKYNKAFSRLGRLKSSGQLWIILVSLSSQFAGFFRMHHWALFGPDRALIHMPGGARSCGIIRRRQARSPGPGTPAQTLWNPGARVFLQTITGIHLLESWYCGRTRLLAHIFFRQIAVYALLSHIGKKNLHFSKFDVYISVLANAYIYRSGNIRN